MFVLGFFHCYTVYLLLFFYSSLVIQYIFMKVLEEHLPGSAWKIKLWYVISLELYTPLFLATVFQFI